MICKISFVCTFKLKPEALLRTARMNFVPRFSRSGGFRRTLVALGGIGCERETTHPVPKWSDAKLCKHLRDAFREVPHESKAIKLTRVDSM